MPPRKHIPHPDPDLSRAPLIHFRAPWGISLWPPHHLAMLRVESTGRLQALSADGEVAFRPGPVPPEALGPLVEVQSGTWINPAHVKRHRTYVEAPDGTRIPCTVRLPVPTTRDETPLPGFDLRPTDVLWFRAGQGGHGHWRTTDHREVPAPITMGQAQALIPELVRAGFHLVNPRHIRGIRERGNSRTARDIRCRLLLAHAEPLPLADRAVKGLQRRLGIPSLAYVESLVPDQLGLYRLGIREFLPDLRRASRECLRALFDDERTLIANVVWQALLERCEGRGTSHRGFWYNPLVVILKRAGFLDVEWTNRLGREREDPYLYYCFTLELMVQEFRLFTYERLGFEDPTPELRRIGKSHPGVVLVCEKTATADIFWRLCDAYGCSGLILRGDSKVIVTEFFAKALRAIHDGPVVVVAWVDFDPWGWTAVDGFVAQMRDCGVETVDARFLVRPSRFSAAELEMITVPLPAGSPARIRSFLERTGGVHGKPLGISMDFLRPYARAADAFEEETGLHSGTPGDASHGDECDAEPTAPRTSPP